MPLGQWWLKLQLVLFNIINRSNSGKWEKFGTWLQIKLLKSNVNVTNSFHFVILPSQRYLASKTTQIVNSSTMLIPALTTRTRVITLQKPIHLIFVIEKYSSFFLYLKKYFFCSILY